MDIARKQIDRIEREVRSVANGGGSVSNFYNLSPKYPFN